MDQSNDLRKHNIVIFESPARRRWWLLTKALEHAPLHRALDLARAAEVFLADSDGIGVQSLIESYYLH